MLPSRSDALRNKKSIIPLNPRNLLEELLTETAEKCDALHSIDRAYLVEFYLTKPNDDVSTFRQYRKFVTAKFFIAAYRMCGIGLVEDGTYKCIPNEPKCENVIKIREFIPKANLDRFRQHIRIGPVIPEVRSQKTLDLQNVLKEADLLHHLYMTRTESCRLINKTCLKQADAVSLKSIVSAVVNWEFLNRVPGEAITISIENTDEIEHYGARGLLYNLNRIKSLLLTFDKRVVDEVFPPLPSLMECWPDEAKAKKQEEIYVLEQLASWPNVLQQALKKGDPTIFTGFMKQFNEKFEKYYNATRVLKPVDARHLYREMYQRIHLYRAIYKVMGQCFRLLHLDF